MNLHLQGVDFALDQVPVSTSRALGKLVARINEIFARQHLPDGQHGLIKCQGALVGGLYAAADRAVISPPPLAAHTHDYNPDGLQAAQIVRLSATGSIDLTGLVCHDRTIAWFLRLVNVSSGPITLKHQDSRSTLYNRIVPPLGADYVLGQHCGADLWFDTVTERWRVLGH